MWVVFEREDNDVVLAKFWKIERKNTDLPEPVTELVPKAELFSHERWRHFKPIPYFSESTKSELNAYNKPMPKDIYEDYWNGMLNCKKHLILKKALLWNRFMQQKCVSTPYREQLEYEGDFNMLYELFPRETEYVECYYDEEFQEWVDKWQTPMIIDENSDLGGVANELIFMK